MPAAQIPARWSGVPAMTACLSLPCRHRATRCTTALQASANGFHTANYIIRGENDEKLKERFVPEPETLGAEKLAEYNQKINPPQGSKQRLTGHALSNRATAVTSSDAIGIITIYNFLVR
ncbi:uncharacterized protein PHACADRAFT_252261 [Phanerochaete carnosa HHB-10118-sp]|uniref:Uncharacterized protein n=1 Tax=Phanerochaete carnosa (strain HHB-10118-sp) TaxID=650164 RepID=K5V635_PHACS|nr:uncharacterized protein PHACADRAFT_252261 [Phanerochaete carnosa HHB-10118-sp]EKM58166.1 hypothetical protein PHACADRAFT_252261 [Phanerochaete carnosa HHB-10118-sp]